jgi:PAS domain S-box-containing protein
MSPPPRRILGRLSTPLHLALGLGGLAVGVVLAASALGLVPDADQAARRHRATLAETLALTISPQLDTTDAAALRGVLATVQARQPELRSVGVRAADGALLLDVDGHAACWPADTAAAGSDSHVAVPLLQGNAEWGRVELCFTPLRATTGIAGLVHDPALRLAGFVFAMGVFGFWFYLRRMLRELDPSRAVPPRVRAAYDTLTEGLLVLDRAGRIVLANRSTGALLGVDEGALVGRSPSAFPWQQPDGAALAAAELPWQQALSDAAPQRDRHLHFARADGARFSLRANCSPIGDDKGRLQALVVSFQDVTELEQRGEALRVAKEQADAANQAKSQFLANMSHEIRTPMNAILGFTDVLRRSRLASVHGDAARHLEIIHSSGQHLLELINDILDLSKVESGRLEAERVPIAPHRVVHDVMATLAERAAAKGLALETTFAGPLPALIDGDAGRLRQIVTNLVGNAIKFTERGGVTVDARLDGGHYVIDVRDTGIGIAADKLDAVFEPFVQAEASTTRRFGGTGLGLTISRGFARAMGGDITIASTPGVGTTFSVRLPLGASGEKAERLAPETLARRDAAAPAAGGQQWRFSPRRVLVADDGEHNRGLVRLLLEEVGLVVEEASNGREAVDRVAAGGIDLVLMDMQMPEMDGATATRTLRDAGCTLPIVALTANAMKGFEAELDAAGFSGFQTKPIDREALMAELAARLGGERVAADAASPDAAAAELPPATDDATPIVSRLAAHPRLARLIGGFVGEFANRRARMHAALDAGDLAELAALAHWLKGSGGSLGFDDLFEPAKALEEAAKAGDAAAAAAALHQVDMLGARIDRGLAAREPEAVA